MNYFQTSVALPPGSPHFKGREVELEFIKSRIRGSSMLIIGGRRMGKTSLLNQVYDWAGTQNDLQPIFIDLLDVQTGADFTAKLIDYCNSVPNFTVNHIETIREFVTETIKKLKDHLNKLPVFLLNEIDVLVENDMNFFLTLRELHDSSEARFIMVGHSVIRRFDKSDDPQSPFFHFTDGNNFDDKAIFLGPLSKSAAKNLFNLLVSEQKGLRWESPDQCTKACSLVLERSYRIPCVLRYFGQLMLEQVEKDRCNTLSFESVERMLREAGRVVWDYFNNIDYSSLGFSRDLPAASSGFRLILFSLARNRYFLKRRHQPAAIITDPRLRDLSPLDSELGFTVDEVRAIVQNTIDQLPTEKERADFKSWLGNIDLAQSLRLLCLALALEPDPKQIDHYGFMLHILPVELFLQYHQNDPLLDNLISNEASIFSTYWSIIDLFANSGS